MEENKLARVLHSVAKRMRADFEQSREFDHNLSAGESRELIAHGFLDRQLPGHVDAICGAEIATAAGKVSPQCDIVLVDRSTPPLTHLQGYRIRFGLILASRKMRQHLRRAKARSTRSRSRARGRVDVGLFSREGSSEVPFEGNLEGVAGSRAGRRHDRQVRPGR